MMKPGTQAVAGSVRVLMRAALFVSFLAVSGWGQEIQIGTNVIASFASVETGRSVLIRRDEFLSALTPLDRRSRMKSDQDVPEKEFLAFLERSVQAWTPEETNRIANILRAVAGPLARWQLPFPGTILFVKTSGEEEFNNCYTRQNAVVFPRAEAARPPGMLRYLVLHELFHVLSRHDAQLRQAVYGVIGFQPINEVELPAELLRRKVTNPDGVQNGWRIHLTRQNETLDAVPILIASGDRFDPNARGANPYDYFRLLVVQQGPAGWTPQLANGHPRLLRSSETTDWQEQIGRNTQYIIHPDEILADNFVRLINGNTNLPTPRITDGMAKAFRAHGAKK